MKIKSLGRLVLVLAFVTVSYSLVNAQVVDAVKKAAEVTKDVTVDAAKKTGEVTKDIAVGAKDVTVDAAKKTAEVTGDVAEGTKDATVDGAKYTGKKAKQFGNKTVEITDNVGEGTGDVAADVWEASAKGTKKTVYYVGNKTSDFAKLGYKGGKYFVKQTWDGTKWVAQKVWIFDKDNSKEL
jgi:hypothetical protein